MRLFILALLAAIPLLGALPLQANPYDDAVQVRLLPGWRKADGTLVAGIELTLAEGWKTYWRAPGDAGIPPVFDWSGSRNLADIRVDWPTPEVFSQNGMRSIGYMDRVVLPLTIAPSRASQPVKLSGVINIGICDEVCVPMHLDLAGTLDGAVTRPDPAIAAALADRPFSAAEAGLRSARCAISPISDGLRIRAEFALPSTGGPEAAVIETGDPLIWASEPALSRRGARLAVEADLVHASGGAFALDRSTLRFTILGRNHAVDITGCDAS